MWTAFLGNNFQLQKRYMFLSKNNFSLHRHVHILPMLISMCLYSPLSTHTQYILIHVLIFVCTVYLKPWHWRCTHKTSNRPDSLQWQEKSNLPFCVCVCGTENSNRILLGEMFETLLIRIYEIHQTQRCCWHFFPQVNTRSHKPENCMCQQWHT